MTDLKSKKIYLYRGLAKDENGYLNLNKCVTKFLEDFRGAIKDYTKVIELDPTNKTAYLYRGQSKTELGNRRGAIIDYSKVIKLDPQNEEAYYLRGKAKYDLKDYENAIKDLSKTIQLNPKNVDAPRLLYKINKYPTGETKSSKVNYSKQNSELTGAYILFFVIVLIFIIFLIKVVQMLFFF